MKIKNKGIWILALFAICCAGANLKEPDELKNEVSEIAIDCIQQNSEMNHNQILFALSSDLIAVRPIFIQADKVKASCAVFLEELQVTSGKKWESKAQSFLVNIEKTMEDPMQRWLRFSPFLLKESAKANKFRELQTLVSILELNATDHLLGKITGPSIQIDTMAPVVLIDPMGYSVGEEASAQVFIAAYSTLEQPKVTTGTAWDEENWELKNSDDQRSIVSSRKTYLKLKTNEPGVQNEVVKIEVKDPKGMYHPFILPIQYVVK